MKKGEVITISGKVASIKSSTRRSRRELIEAKKDILDKIGDLDGLNDDELYEKFGAVYKTVAEHVLDFSGGTPDLKWFSSEDFEDKYLRELESDFLSI